MADTEFEDTPQALSALPAGARGVIHSLLGERSFGSRVANLGFTVGAPVSVRQNYGRGPMIVARCAARWWRSVAPRRQRSSCGWRVNRC